MTPPALDAHAKRQKRYGKKPKQSTTCTQLWRPFLEAEIDAGSDGDTDDVKIESPPKRSLRRSRRTRAKEESPAPNEFEVQHQLDTQLQGHLLSDQILEINSNEQHITSSSSSLRSKRADGVSSPALPDDQSTRPSTADPAAHPSTPLKPRRTEVPSSQTPSSITLSKLAKQDQEWDEMNVRSPLKEKSCNIGMTKPSPDFDRPETLEDSQSGELDAVVEDSAYSTLSQPVWTAKLAMTPKKQVKHKEIPLERTAIIPDSEADSLELVESRSPARANATSSQQVEVSEEEKPSSGPQKKPARTFERVTTIQESESESELDGLEDEFEAGNEDDLEAGNGDDLEAGNGDDFAAEKDYDENEPYENYDTTLMESETYQQNTYDPVAAALERDAARYGMTKTQVEAESHPTSISQFYGTQAVGLSEAVEDDEEEDDDDDLDGPRPSETHIVISSQPEEMADVVISSQPEEVEIVKASQASQELGSDPADLPQPSVPKDVDSAVPRPVEATQSRSQSQLPLAAGTQTQRRRFQARPSQLSTVVPSQWSRHGSAEASPSTSPERSQQARPFDTVSSSPFPIPPWNSSQAPQRRYETQDSLINWSLPPPPPLPLSSSRQDTSSSL